MIRQVSSLFQIYSRQMYLQTWIFAIAHITYTRKYPLRYYGIACNIREIRDAIFLLEYVVAKRGLCNGYKSGEDDLQTFDFISKLKLDLDARYSGMTKVRGSNRMQTAYRLEKGTDVTLPTKYSN